MTTAFVLSGGASLGAVEVGMLRALAERDVVPDMLFGTSVGAINAAVMADQPGMDGVERLTSIWTSLRRNDVFPVDAITLMRAALRHDHLVSAAPLRRLIRRNLDYERLEDARLPLTVIATEVTTGLEVVLSSGDVTDALVASSALPGVFRPVRIGDQVLMDGGVADHTPISQAVAAGADTVYVLVAGYACALLEPPGDALGMAMHAISLLTTQRMMRDVRDYQDQLDLRVLPPPCPLRVGPTDFSRAQELIDLGHASATRYLDGPRPVDQSSMLSLHRHG